MSNVQDIVNSIKYRVDHPEFTDDDGVTSYVLPLVNQMVRQIDMVLYWEKSDFVRNPLVLELEALDASVALPADCVGLVEEPWLDGATALLVSLPDRETALANSTAGTPVYYEIINDMLYIYPPTAAACTLKGFYFKLSDKLLSATDVMPYNEIFDTVIQEFLVKTYWLANSRQNASGQFTPVVFDEKLQEEFQRAIKGLLVRRSGMRQERVLYPGFA